MAYKDSDPDSVQDAKPSVISMAYGRLAFSKKTTVLDDDENFGRRNDCVLPDDYPSPYDIRER